MARGLRKRTLPIHLIRPIQFAANRHREITGSTLHCKAGMSVGTPDDIFPVPLEKSAKCKYITG